MCKINLCPLLFKEERFIFNRTLLVHCAYTQLVCVFVCVFCMEEKCFANIEFYSRAKRERNGGRARVFVV